MADAAKRDAIMQRRNERLTESLRAEAEATRLEVEIDRQRRKVEKAEANLDRELIYLRGLESLRKPEGK